MPEEFQVTEWIGGWLKFTISPPDREVAVHTGWAERSGDFGSSGRRGANWVKLAAGLHDDIETDVIAHRR